jgi:hypothetical protein
VKRQIPPELVPKLQEWLGEKGKKFFLNLKEKHGKIDAVFVEHGIPHPVHFREGMQIRNFMRLSKLCDDWTAHDFDESWVDLVEQAVGIQ